MVDDGMVGHGLVRLVDEVNQRAGQGPSRGGSCGVENERLDCRDGLQGAALASSSAVSGDLHPPVGQGGGPGDAIGHRGRRLGVGLETQSRQGGQRPLLNLSLRR